MAKTQAMAQGIRVCIGNSDMGTIVFRTNNRRATTAPIRSLYL